MTFIATFYSHFGAIRFKKWCEEKHCTARVMPVPRDLSSSCGTCVRYEAEQAAAVPPLSEEIEQIVQWTAAGYIPVYKAENS